jgi:DNA uptake protein ComE-like DNA-binding protein
MATEREQVLDDRVQELERAVKAARLEVERKSSEVKAALEKEESARNTAEMVAVESKALAKTVDDMVTATTLSENRFKAFEEDAALKINAYEQELRDVLKLLDDERVLAAQLERELEAQQSRQRKLLAAATIAQESSEREAFDARRLAEENLRRALVEVEEVADKTRVQQAASDSASEEFERERQKLQKELAAMRAKGEELEVKLEGTTNTIALLNQQVQDYQQLDEKLASLLPEVTEKSTKASPFVSRTPIADGLRASYRVQGPEGFCTAGNVPIGNCHIHKSSNGSFDFHWQCCLHVVGLTKRQRFPAHHSNKMDPLALPYYRATSATVGSPFSSSAALPYSVPPSPIKASDSGTFSSERRSRGTDFDRRGSSISSGLSGLSREIRAGIPKKEHPPLFGNGCNPLRRESPHLSPHRTRLGSSSSSSSSSSSMASERGSPIKFRDNAAYAPTQRFSESTFDLSTTSVRGEAEVRVLNSLTGEEIQALRGVSDTSIHSLLRHRDSLVDRRFDSLAELDLVPGLDHASAQKVKGLVERVVTPVKRSQDAPPDSPPKMLFSSDITSPERLPRTPQS